MPVNQIQADANIDPLKQQQIQKLKQAVKGDTVENKEQQKSGDSVQISQMARDIMKYTKNIDDIPTPNEGRIAELQKAVQDGSLLKQDAIDGAAAAITDVLLG